MLCATIDCNEWANFQGRGARRQITSAQTNKNVTRGIRIIPRKFLSNFLVLLDIIISFY